METNSILTLEQRKKLTLTGVESVDAFSEARIILTVSGSKVTIEGQRLKVLSFSQGTGSFSASGEVRSVRYGGAKALSLFK